jgi:2-oxoglutarate dehydrogenase E2 component (dihydrolipoamide succinyltransferase)
LEIYLHVEIGDFVKADEEVATIETDKIDVAVNAPASGVIVEQFANEEDTVVVAANLFKLEKKDVSEGEHPLFCLLRLHGS